jgi:radical SAM superfamily enzyme YgiQ (UPF0313 family)
MGKPLTMAASAYQMSEAGCCDTPTTSGLPLRNIRPRKIHCILPSSPWLADSKTNIPLGVLYIAGLLRAQGHEVVVTSMLDKRYEGNIHLPDAVMDSDVHMFGFCTPQFGEALELAAYIKDRNPEALLVAGGPHPSYEPKEVKEAGRQDAYHYKGALTQRRDYRAADGRQLFDTVIVMEGEVATLQMLSDWDAGQLQPYYYGDKADAMDLDAIPFPAWDLLPQDHIYNDGVAVMKTKYFPNAAHPDASSAVMSIIGTRGCPYKCFAAGTLIAMADGSERPIETLRMGDVVVSIESNTGRLTSQRITGVGQREADDVYDAHFSNGLVLRVTRDHPFWTYNGWQSIGNIEGLEVWRVPGVSDGVSAVSHDVRCGDMHSSATTRDEDRCVEPNEARRRTRSGLSHDAHTSRREVVSAGQGQTRRWFNAVRWDTGSDKAPRHISTDESIESDATARRGGSTIDFAQDGLQRRAMRSAVARLFQRWRATASRLVQAMVGVVAAYWKTALLDWPVRVWNASESGLRQSVFSSRGVVQRQVLAHAGGYPTAIDGLRIARMASVEPLGGLLARSDNTAPDSLNISGGWVRLDRLTFVGRDIVYPITVETHQNFIVNGLLVHNCTYCSTPWIGQKPRYRSPHNIITEMAQVMDKGVRMFKFQDDTYTLHRSKLRELALAVHAAFGADSFAARIHTRVNTMDDHVAESLKLMNTRVTCFGIESGSQRVLDANQKGTTVAQNTAALITAKKHGFYTIAFLVAGLAGETRETARETMAWLASVKPYLDSCNLAVGIPYPGSRWWTHPQASGLEILDYNYDNQWIVGFSARDEILVRPHGTTVAEMYQIKREMFDFLVEHGWAKAEWDEDVRIKAQQAEAVANGTLTAASGLTYAGQ